MDALRAGVQSIYAKLGCPAPGDAALLGERGVTETNLSQHLGIVEQRTNEILQVYAAAQAAARVEAEGGGGGSSSLAVVTSILGKGPQHPAGRNAIWVQPPRVDSDGSDASEEGEEGEGAAVPVRHDELKARLMQQAKREYSRGVGGAPRVQRGRQDAERRSSSSSAVAGVVK
mmetsp:Transcript_1598/g.4753  ORF Transcript_1598/g.4753 Transcript_1598/m.4753 type:complete len:173 (-) Transcript_1598:81-599(-)